MTGKNDAPLLSGLVAAVFTPMHPDGSLSVEAVPAVVDFVLGQGVDGLFLCGSTGEGASLTREERMAIAEAYVAAARGRAPVVAQVGHNSLAEARALAAHAEGLGVDAISVAPPSYFRPGDVGAVIDCLAEVASAAPATPLYYYHIPRITGVELPVHRLLERAVDELPTLGGVKYSAFELDGLIRCIACADGRYNLLFGADEMLLAGLAMGADGAVGSTYNFLGPFYRRVIEAFEAGRIDEAQAHQLEVTRLVHTILDHGGLNAIKASMNHLGVDCGPPRLPLPALSSEQLAGLASSLDLALGRAGGKG